MTDRQYVLSIDVYIDYPQSESNGYEKTKHDLLLN